MKYEPLGKYVSLSQGLVVNKSTEHLFADKQDDVFVHPLLRIVDFESNRHSDFSKYVSSSISDKVIIDEKTIVYTRVTCQCFRGFKGVVHNNLFIVKLINDEIVEDYLYTILQSSFVKKQALTYAQSSVVPDLTHEMFKSIIIPVPDRKVQESIASIYGSISEKIENNNAICSDLEGMAKLLYDYWFVQFDFPDEKEKPYKSSGGKMVWNEHLKRRIPEDWTVERLGNYCNFENGDRSNNYPSGDDFIPIGIPFIAGGAIKDNGINYTELRYISEEKFCSLRAGKANYGDILMTLRGSLAKYVLSPFEKLAIASALVIVRPKGIVTNEYLYSVLTSDYYNQLMSNYNNGSVQANLSVDVVRTFPIIIPDKAIMDRFSKVQCELIKMKMLLDSENRQLTTIRDFLLPMLLNGQVKVKETENTLSEM